jgi:hypothetical protein
MGGNGSITIDQLNTLLPEAVFLPIPKGKKRPILPGWQKVELAATRDPAYQHRLAAHANTGILLGRASENLCAIDIDSDENIDVFLALNPSLRNTLQSRGKRGCQLWIYVDGDYPHNVVKLKDHAGRGFGEWRADGGQSVIRGLHPEGVHYRIICDAPPLRIRFDAIHWPRGLVLPWNEEPKQHAAMAQTRTILANKIPIELPGENKLESAFSLQLGTNLHPYDFFQRAGQVVMVSRDPVSGELHITTVDHLTFQTALEAICAPFSRRREREQVFRSISPRLASTVLSSPDFREQLRCITALHSVRLPVRRDSGVIEILPEGFDNSTGILTVTDKGADWTGVRDRFSAEKAREYFHELMSEFCFREGDRERAISIVVAGALTLFTQRLANPVEIRPSFLFTANAAGAGKGLLARIATVGPAGLPSARSAPKEQDEMRKEILSKILGGSSVLFLDNLKGHLSSPPLEALVTSPHFEGRILGASKEVRMLHGLTIFATGNGLTISPDLRRRFLHVDLFMKEIRAEDRAIERPIADELILAERRNILAALWALVHDWSSKGQPKGKAIHNSFVKWSERICGILENAGFASPCSLYDPGTAGDIETQDVEKLVDLLNPDRYYKLSELIEVAADHGLFARLIPEDGQIEKSNQIRFSLMMRRFVGRTFRSGAQFNITGDTRRTQRFFVTELAAADHKRRA